MHVSLANINIIYLGNKWKVDVCFEYFMRKRSNCFFLQNC